MERLSGFEIFAQLIVQFTPVWISLAIIITLIFIFKNSLGLLGKLTNSPIGMIGLFLVLFWILTAVFTEWIAPFDPRDQIAAMKHKKIGWPVVDLKEQYYLFGGDKLGRDVFSRMVYGGREVLLIAPLATLLAFMVGVSLGLPAGYFGKLTDTVLTFLSNLVLAFPVILLFFLLVTPEIRSHGTEWILPWSGNVWISSIPNLMAMFLFFIPIVFFLVLWTSKFSTDPKMLSILVIITLILCVWAYSGLVFNSDPLNIWSMNPNLLNVFVSVVFVNSPTVFRIVRGLTIDIKTRDYVAAAQTRGERPWYIMLWEILPNARGPLIVDFCLRIGYTTILLGTLGFFGLGVDPESPNWGGTINEGRKLLPFFSWTVFPPALALMSLVLGLNLLADGLREESLKD